MEWLAQTQAINFGQVEWLAQTQAINFGQAVANQTLILRLQVGKTRQACASGGAIAGDDRFAANGPAGKLGRAAGFPKKSGVFEEAMRRF